MLNAIRLGICGHEFCGLRCLLLMNVAMNILSLQKFENFLTSWVTVGFQDGVFSGELFS
jgi:hypothetical protein